MRQAKIEDARVFFSWLDEEREYLISRDKTPLRETLEMEYLENLKDLEICRLVSILYIQLDALERSTRHLRKDEMKYMRDLHVLEQKLEINTTWERGSDEWERVDLMAKNAEYQKALDHLEGLLVSRIFELGKAHLAGTGELVLNHMSLSS
ncbi:hypothetical protein K435DRAFT_697600 [Dendrothele bispora CBS 962.96]|uniref:Uncharacterized protein n=1 Tax=Dendrothele bispora (strain CBS 962.96) TaxID=1314807 RepID=A0A4S8KUF4_DENBC|nr:hypothetical protein K435DRAFT_697600 [Dendrothele bispora CBS 962.96]